MNQDIVKQLLDNSKRKPRPNRHRKTNIPNVMLWMKTNAYEPTTIKRAAKELRHLERNCNTNSPKEVKLFIANKTCSNARKENLIESYNIAIHALELSWDKPFYQRHDKKRRAPKEESIQFIISHVKFPLNLKLKISL